MRGGARHDENLSSSTAMDKGAVSAGGKKSNSTLAVRRDCNSRLSTKRQIHAVLVRRRKVMAHCQFGAFEQIVLIRKRLRDSTNRVFEGFINRQTSDGLRLY